MEDRYLAFTKNPESYPELFQLHHKLTLLPTDAFIRYMDPLYLPENSFVFRGIGSRKGTNRACDGIVDLFERGIGNGELTHASEHQGTWAKVGQVFCALDISYVKHGFLDENDVLIVIKGNLQQ